MVCRSGSKGTAFVAIDPQGSMSLSGIAVYRCVTWGHFIVWNPQKQVYEYNRTVNGATKVGGMSSASILTAWEILQFAQLAKMEAEDIPQTFSPTVTSRQIGFSFQWIRSVGTDS